MVRVVCGNHAASSMSLELVKYLLSIRCPDGEVSTADVNAGHIASPRLRARIARENAAAREL